MDEGRHDVAGRFHARVEEDRRPGRSRGAGRCSLPRRGRGARSSRRPRWDAIRGAVRGARVARASSAAACSGDGPSATMTTDVPSGAVARMPASARARSSGQSVAISTTVADADAGSSKRDGTPRLEPYRIRSPSARSGGAAGVSAKSVPRSTIFQPAASISARSRSASAQSRRDARRGAGVRSGQHLVGDPSTAHRAGSTGARPARLSVLGGAAQGRQDPVRIQGGQVERQDDARGGHRPASVSLGEPEPRSQPRAEVGGHEVVRRHHRSPWHGRGTPRPTGTGA